MKKKPPTRGSTTTLNEMWSNSITDREILKVIDERYRKYATVSYFGEYWFIILPDVILVDYVRESNPLVFRMNEKTIKVVDHKTDIVKFVKSMNTFKELLKW